MVKFRYCCAVAVFIMSCFQFVSRVKSLLGRKLNLKAGKEANGTNQGGNDKSARDHSHTSNLEFSAPLIKQDTYDASIYKTLKNVCYDSQYDTVVLNENLYSRNDYVKPEKAIEAIKKVLPLFKKIELASDFLYCVELVFYRSNAEASYINHLKKGCPEKISAEILALRDTFEWKIVVSSTTFPKEAFYLIENFYQHSNFKQLNGKTNMHPEKCISELVTVQKLYILAIQYDLYYLMVEKFGNETVLTVAAVKTWNSILFGMPRIFTKSEGQNIVAENGLFIKSVFTVMLLSKMSKEFSVPTSLFHEDFLPVKNTDAHMFYLSKTNDYTTRDISINRITIKVPSFLYYTMRSFKKRCSGTFFYSFARVSEALREVSQRVNDLALPAVPFAFQTLFYEFFVHKSYDLQACKEKFEKIYAQLDKRTKTFIALAADLKRLLEDENVWDIKDPHTGNESMLRMLVYSILSSRAIKGLHLKAVGIAKQEFRVEGALTEEQKVIHIILPKQLIEYHEMFSKMPEKPKKSLMALAEGAKSTIKDLFIPR